jgi:vitamin B12 transporter
MNFLTLNFLLFFDIKFSEKFLQKGGIEMKKEGWIVFVIIFFTLLKNVLIAGEVPDVHTQIVVTPSRIEESLKISPNNILIITGKELQKKGIKTLDEALKNLPGMMIVQNGSGGITSVFARGLDSKYTVILIDGVKVYDPSGINQGEAGWIIPALSVQDIDRIEIVKGVNSVTYGSNAIGGVVNIITKKPKKFQFRVWSEVGSYETFNKGMSINAAEKGVSSYFSLIDLKVEGFSKKEDQPDKDPYHNISFKTGIDLKRDNLQLGQKIYLTKVKQYLDGSNEKEEDFISTFNTYLNFKVNPKFSNRFQFAYTLTDRNYDDSQDNYKGNLIYFLWQGEIEFVEKFKIIPGIEYEKEEMKINDRWGTNLKKGVYQYSPFLKLLFKSSRYFLRAGARYTKHGKSGDSVVWEVAGYLFPVSWMQLHNTVGTGFAVPSLYQLYSFFTFCFHNVYFLSRSFNF